MKYFLLVACLLAIFIWLAPSLIGRLDQLFNPPYVTVDFSTVVNGKIVSHEANRRKYTFRLVNRKEIFDFDRFVNEALWKHNRLGTYLQDGDEITKLANSDTLILTREGQVSQWQLASQASNLH